MENSTESCRKVYRPLLLGRVVNRASAKTDAIVDTVLYHARPDSLGLTTVILLMPCQVCSIRDGAYL